MKLKYPLLITVLTLLATVASAGLKQPTPVEVDLANMFAIGDQVTARIAPNDLDFIGCGFRVFDIPFSFGFCQATDSEENAILCITENADLIDAIKATSAYAFITFSWKDDGFGGSECIRVGSSTQSFYLPNFTTKGKK